MKNKDLLKKRILSFDTSSNKLKYTKKVKIKPSEEFRIKKIYNISFKEATYLNIIKLQYHQIYLIFAFVFTLCTIIFGIYLNSLFAGIVVGLFTMCFPYYIIKAIIRKRYNEFYRQISIIIDEIMNGLKVNKSISIIFEELMDDRELNIYFRNGFKQFYQMIQAGQSMNYALSKIKNYINIPEYKLTMNMLHIGYNKGNNELIQSLVNIQKRLNNRLENLYLINQNISGQQNQFLILLVIPLFMLFVLKIFNHDYYSSMLKLPLGKLIFASVFILLILGVLVVNYILLNSIKKVSE
ncbi:hypothetical protein KHQ81_15520 (plasmid) [Mycoplasmatota bacterium]|nr:hypothetical protein KHQ81_15520 [Mycoplasmatota bacterium]